MSTHQEQLATVVLSPIAFITGYIGLNLTEVDLLMAIVLKALSMISVVCIIIVNWEKMTAQVKKWLNTPKNGRQNNP